MNMEMTPWGPPVAMETLAAGIIQIRTASGGGVWLSPDRWRELLDCMPDFYSSSGPQWLAGERDALAIYVVWPSLAAGDSLVYRSLRAVHMTHPSMQFPAAAVNIVQHFVGAHGNEWEVVDVSTDESLPPDTYRLVIRRVGDGVESLRYGPYPCRRFYSWGDLIVEHHSVPPAHMPATIVGG